jgi:hypothetical protein
MAGNEPPIIEKLRKEGKLKEFKNADEARQAARARKKRGVEEMPLHLLPDDYFRKRKRANVTLSSSARATAKKLGNGVMSRGIERALLHYQECPRTGRKK